MAETAGSQAPEGPGTRARVSRWGLAPIPVVVAVLGLLGRVEVIPLAIVVLVVVFQLRVASPRLDRGVENLLGGIGRAVSSVVRLVLLGVVELVVVLPVSAAAWVLGWNLVDPFGGRFDPRPSTGGRTARRSFALDRTANRRTSRRHRAWTAAALVVGLPLAFLIVDLAVGWTWDAITDRGAPSAEAAPAVDDPPVDSPALVDAPWRDEYYSTLAALDHEPTPFLYLVPGDVQSAHINVTDGVRRSYAPASVPGRSMPDVWFFGGSALWGEGQRDEHTVPSEVARMAEAQGLPIHVSNLGQRGDVSWQELLRFERRLAHAEAPTVVVFYDGLNDLWAQTRQPTRPDPSHFGQEATSRVLWAHGLDPGDLGPVPDSGLADDLSDLWSAYAETGAVARLTGAVFEQFGSEESEEDESDPPAATDHDTVAAAADIHRRFVSVAGSLAVAHGVEPHFFWQPARPGDDATRLYPALTDRIGEPVVDLSGALDGVSSDDVYVNDAHTNERGARLVAEQLWLVLRAQVRDWYARGGSS